MKCFTWATDIPDYNVMTKVGLPVCPNDAALKSKKYPPTFRTGMVAKAVSGM